MQEHFTQNQLEKLGRQEGWKVRNDIVDMPDTDEIAAEVERDSFTEGPARIAFEGVAHDKRTARLAEETAEFVQRLVVHYQQAFSRMLHEYPDRKIDPRILAYIRERRLDTPRVRILGVDAGNALLTQAGYSPHLSAKEVLVVFLLPKPLDHFWRKGASPLSGGTDVRGMVIEWGRMYEELLNVVWGYIRDSATHPNLSMMRENETGHHARDAFYYLFSVRRTQ